MQYIYIYMFIDFMCNTYGVHFVIVVSVHLLDVHIHSKDYVLS